MRIETTILSSLLYNEEYTRKVIPFIRQEYFSDHTERTIFKTINDYVEKYIRTTGNAKDGLYCYNFCLDSSQREYQPSGAMNMNKFKYVQLEYNTIEPPIDPSANIINICDGAGNIIGVRKSTTDLYEYNYDLRVFEERYNVVIITSGNIGLKWAK